MQKDIRQEEPLSPEIQETMRSIVSAIRAVRLYPPNNPVYSKSVQKSFEAVDNFLRKEAQYHIGVYKTYFTFRNTPLGKDTALHMPIAQDLFTKGIREIIFTSGLTEAELLDLYLALALSADEQHMKSGVSSILREKGALHIKVTEAGLDDVVAFQTTQASAIDSEESSSKKQIGFPGHTLVLDGLMTDPVGFSVGMVEEAKQTKAEHETVEDRLFALYEEAGRKIDEQDPSQRETLYEDLAKSVLSLDPRYRNEFIAGRLSGELDAVTDQQLPSAIHEVQTERFSDTWTVQEMATLLKKTVSGQITSSIVPNYPAEIETIPVAQDLITITQEMTMYSAEDMEELKAFGDAGMELDTIKSSMHTLISLIPLVQNPQHAKPEENDITNFSGIINQLENMLNYFLKKKDYQYATCIINAFYLPVEPAFKPRMMEALKKTADKSGINAAITEIRKLPKDSPEYHSAYVYLSAFERESTEALLKLLAEEKDKAASILYIDLVKDIGKNQIALLEKHLADVRWYFVCNIVNILGESKAPRAIAFLLKVADHQNVMVRQEVIQGLISIGGKKAAGVLAKFLKDKDDDVKRTAIRAFSGFPDIGAEEAKPLIDFLDKQQLNKKDQDFTLEAIKALGKIGDNNSGIFLKRYDRIRWWKSRKLQEELRATALSAIKEITRRRSNG